MTGWPAVLAFYAIAVAIAAGVMVYAGRVQAARPETRKVIPLMFPWLEERRTYANVVSIARYARQRPLAWMIIVFASAPTVSALAVSLVGDGPAELSSVVDRLAPWTAGASSTDALLTYAVILVVFVAVCAVFLRVAQTAADDQQPALLRGRSRPAVWGRLLGGAVVDEGGTLEEIGWRGFALPVLAVAMGSAWQATAVVAVAWWAWHLPREVPALLHSPPWRRFVVQQAQFVLLCAALSVLMTAAWLHTGSVWPAVLIHGGTNVWSKAIGGPMWTRTSTDVRTWIVVGLAVVVLLVAVAG